MADISEEFITYLKTKSAVTDLIGSGTSARIWNQDGPPQSQARPSVCVVKTRHDNSGHLGGRSAFDSAEFVVTSYADSPASRNALCSAIYNATSVAELAAANDTMGSTPVSEVYCVTRQIDEDFLPTDGSDKRLYAARSTYTIWFYTS